MTESVRNSDRMHAIEFGKFYLKVFGGSVEKAEMRDIFQNWNIGFSSEFAKQEADSFDPRVFERVADAINAVRGNSTKDK